MNLKSLGLAVAAGLTTFLVVGVTVTELAASRVEFSVFVGLPAGILAGVLVAGGVYVALGQDSPVGRRRVAAATGVFGIGFLAVLVAVAGPLGAGVGTGLVVATVVGAAVAVAAYLRPLRSSSTSS